MAEDEKVTRMVTEVMPILLISPIRPISPIGLILSLLPTSPLTTKHPRSENYLRSRCGDIP